MVLRESGRLQNKVFNIEAIMQPTLEVGVEGGGELLAFADAILSADRNELDRARLALADVLGKATVASASIIAADFSKNDRIANGLGIPIEPMELKPTADFREALGINQFRSAANSLS